MILSHAKLKMVSTGSCFPGVRPFYCIKESLLKTFVRIRGPAIDLTRSTLAPYAKRPDFARRDVIRNLVPRSVPQMFANLAKHGKSSTLDHLLVVPYIGPARTTFAAQMDGIR